MSFKLKGIPYNKDDMNIAVYRKPLDDGSMGKSNHTGIIVDTKADANTEKAVIAHETVHQHQQRDGELDYDSENFYWKGKTYPRENLNEHNENLPWEKEAYKESNKILNGNKEDMKKTFKLDGYRGNNKPFKGLTDRKLIGSQDDGASVGDPPKKYSSIEGLRNSVKYEMTKDPARYGIKPGDRESRYLDTFKKDTYYTHRIKEDARKSFQQSKKDIVVDGETKIQKGTVTDKERIEGRNNEYSDLSITNNIQYDKHGDRDYSKIGAPRPDVMGDDGKMQSGYKLKGNLPGQKKNTEVERGANNKTNSTVSSKPVSSKPKSNDASTPVNKTKPLKSKANKILQHKIPMMKTSK
tara:strand:+ start:578 stop:1636 length:1059 start_codon:yes stop_codon:yes gene_type:complete